MATKIKDGLFIGDAEASQDPEFIELNKITFVINCAGRQLPNLWEQHGLHYLTFPWTSEPDCVLFDGGNVVILQITNFIDEALKKGDSVLVHSLDGTGRCIACLTAYLMFRHRWGFEKTLDFLCSKRPDAAPNAGFVQQLYHLDLRLCAQWYGPDKEPPESERLRHNQWVPIVPDLLPKSGHRQHTDGRRPGRQASVTSDPRGQSAAASTTANATAMRFDAAASGFPPLGRLSEVQEEEIVLVHSFLNSQPQIDALPPGRADYEDHVSKELHWIDRPRIDKLAAAGRMSRKDRRQHIIPVSPRTGLAVPERPGNSSYNALNRDVLSTSMTIPLVGILKQDKIDEGTRNNGGKPSSRPRALVSQSGVRGLGTTASGDDAVAAASAGSGGGGALLPSRRAGVAKVEDEVVVEDLSEPRSDRWSAGGDDVEAGKSELESASGGDMSNSTHAQASRLTDDSSAEDEDTAPRIVGCKRDGERSPEEASGREGSAPAVRQEERQAWDGRRASDAAPDVADGGGKARVGNRRGDVAVQHETTRGDEKTSTPPHARTTPSSNHRPKGGGIFPDKSSVEIASTRWNGEDTVGGVGEGRRRDTLDKTSGPKNTEANTDPLATVAVNSTAATLTKPKLRRRGSEGSLSFSTAEISMSAGLAQDKKYLPQAPGGRSANPGKQASTDLPGPGWGPADVQHGKEASYARRREQGEGMANTRREAYRKEQLGWGREGSEQGLYPAGEGGGSLQQLAQTPNPQQRRLPSPRPQPEHGQGRRKQNASDSANIFPQKRPNSAPPQRPDASEGDASVGGGPDDEWGGGGASSNLAEAVTRTPTPIGTAHQGYPVHGLMPSGSTLQLNAHDRGRSQGGTNGKSVRSWPMQSPEVLVGSGGGDRGGDGPREASAASSALGSGNYSSAEWLRSAQTPSGTATNTESRGADARRSGRRGRSGGPLPREIRASQAAAPSAEPSSARGVGFAGPPSSERPVGALSTEFTRSAGARREFGSSGHPSQAKSLAEPSAGSLPVPSRRGGSSNGGASGGGGAVRWANPSPRGRPGDSGGSTAAYAHSGSIDSGGGGGSVPARASKSLGEGYSPSISKRPHASPGGGPRSSRSAGAPIYRSGSPAPTRGRRSATAASAAASGSVGVAGMSDAERFLNRNKTHGPRQPQQGSGIPPSFRGYIAPNGGGVGEGFGHKSTARRSLAPSPTARDRRRRMGGDGDGQQDAIQRGEGSRGLSPGAMPRSSPVESSPGQRPSTSEGLAGGGGGGGGLRGRSPSPGPRPSSASGRRRSPSPSPANPLGGAPIRRSTSRTGVAMDGSFDRPRWK